jgi:hippurate hydrolase
MSSMSELHGFLDEARALLPAAVALRRRIHAKPELGLDLPLTTAAVLDELRGLHVGVDRGASTSGLIVTLTGTGPNSAALSSSCSSPAKRAMPVPG